MDTTHDKSEVSRRAAVLVMLAVLAAGCRKAPAPAAVDSADPVLERIEETIAQLQAERTARRTEADLGEAVAALRVNKEPPPPPPAPPSEPQAEPAAPPPAPEALEPLRLQGVIRHPSAPLAIINGKTLAVGETVARHRIESIGTDEVVLAGPDGAPVRLRFHELSSPAP